VKASQSYALRQLEPIGNQGHRQPDQGGPKNQRTNPLVVWPRLPDQVAEACRKHYHGNVSALVEQYPRECDVLDAEQMLAESRAVVDGGRTPHQVQREGQRN
jgi:hypothetical protein